MKSINKFLIAVSLAILVSAGVEAYGQTPAQSALPLPAVDTAKTRQRVVRKTTDSEPTATSRSVDDPTDILVMTDEAAAKVANTAKPGPTASVKSAGQNNSNQPVMTDPAQPKPALETKSTPRKTLGIQRRTIATSRLPKRRPSFLTTIISSTLIVWDRKISSRLTSSARIDIRDPQLSSLPAAAFHLH